jgi:lysophosphatidate acyltransferase
MTLITSIFAFHYPVLPPIPTSGLTAADVNDLAIRVRDQMLEVLRDISVTVPSKQQAAKSLVPSSHSTSSDPISTSKVTSDAEVKIAIITPVPGTLETSVDTESSTGSETSNRRMEGSENGAETEEDEGMVLVGRPA